MDNNATFDVPRDMWQDMCLSEVVKCLLPNKTTYYSTRHYIAGPRKMRLMAVACAYILRGITADQVALNAIIAAEKYADSLISRAELRRIRGTADNSPNTVIIEAITVESALLAFDRTMFLIMADRWQSIYSMSKTDMIARSVIDDIVNPYFNGSIPTNDTIVGLAETIYWDKDYSLMPILGDALEDAGCTSDEVLLHCRDNEQPYKQHYRGCWVVDTILEQQ